MPKQIKQLIFDCDNTLVLSEDVAFEACADLANEVLTDNNIPNRYTGEQLITEFFGHKFRGMLAGLQKKHKFELTQDQINHYTKREEDIVIEKLRAKARPCPGSMEVLENLYAEKRYGLAIASSSALHRIRASIEKVGQDQFFPREHIYSASTSLPKPAFKPCPDVYLHAMNDIGVKPEECVAVEDSKSGARSAVNANVPCIAFVGAYSTKEQQDQVAETLMGVGCRIVMYHWSEFFDCLKHIERS